MTAQNYKTYNTDSYDQFVDDMLISKGDIKDWTIALAEEVGELCGKLKRLNRGDYGKAHEIFQYDVVKELGDILYYLTTAAHSIGFDLSKVMNMNVDKLLERKSKNKIMGSGDSR